MGYIIWVITYKLFYLSMLNINYKTMNGCQDCSGEYDYFYCEITDTMKAIPVIGLCCACEHKYLYQGTDEYLS